LARPRMPSVPKYFLSPKVRSFVSGNVPKPLF
jgi:hypothetical protein